MRSRGDLPPHVKVGGLVAVLLVVLVIVALSTTVMVGTGEVDVQKDRGATTGVVYEPGWHYLVNPVTISTETIPTRPQVEHMDDDAAIYIITQDGQDVWADVTVRYRVNAEDAVLFHDEYNTHSQARERLIRPTVRSNMRDEGSDLSARDIITREGRLSLEAAVSDALRENFEGSGLTLEAVQVRGIELNEGFAAELEQVEIERTVAEQALIEAEGQAAAEVAAAEGAAEAYEIRDAALTENVLIEAYIESIDESDTVILATDGDGVPIILNTDDQATNVTVEQPVEPEGDDD